MIVVPFYSMLRGMCLLNLTNNNPTEKHIHVYYIVILIPLVNIDSTNYKSSLVKMHGELFERFE